MLLFTIISLAGLSSIYQYQRIITYFVIPLILCLGFSLNNFTLASLTNIYSRYFLGIVILGVFLLGFSLNLEVAFQNLTTLAGVFLTILLTIEFLNSRKYNFTETFLVSFVFAFFILAAYLFAGLGKSEVDITGAYIDRGQFDMNANVYSYFSYFANIALFYLIQITGKKIYITLSCVCLVLGVYLSFITASRSGILFTMLIGILYWIFIFNKFRINPFLRLLIIMVLLAYGINNLYTIYNDSFLKLRVDLSVESGDARATLAKEAIYVFLNHPFTGVGPGQFYQYASNRTSFSHNAYTEIAANMGIVGIILLLSLMVNPILKELKNPNKGDKAVKKLNLLFFFSFLLINNIYVFYLTTYGMIFFFIIIMIQKKNINNTLFS